MWDMGLRQCSSCGIFYPRTTDYFYPLKRGAYGLQSICIECDKLAQKKRRQKDPLRYRLYAQHYAYRIKRAGGTFSKEDILAIYRRQGGKCAYCSMSLNGKFTIDHIQPLSQGGTNWPDNIALSCSSCNSSKRDKSVEEWKRSRGF